MKLNDLDPRWCIDADIVLGGRVAHDENRIGMGLSFACPCCVGTPRETRLALFVSNPVDGKPPADGCAALWRRAGTSFDDLTLSPSIDASAHGHWHGFVTHGEIVGL